MAARHGLIEPIDISLPALPAELEGLRIAQVTDLHVTRKRRRHRHILDALALSRADMIVLTGDYITSQGQEPAALDLLQRLCDCVSPRHGLFGVFGNHDTIALSRALAGLPVHWLRNASVLVDGLPLEMIGLEALNFGARSPDALATLASSNGVPRPGSARLMLSHFSSCLPAAADLGVDVMFSGHTHGGQFRLPGRRPLANRCDWPLHLTSGLIRHKQTLCVVSRGLGEVHVPLRVFCAPHVPLVTLRRGPLPGKATQHIENVIPW